jgi:UDP-N-acetylglucosamine diphosphorylase/glucosamine-1-phosphate N-acetyltransferase
MSEFRLVLFDDDSREQFLPLAWTKPVADFRIGIFTIREKWAVHLKSETTSWTVDYLRNTLFPFSPDKTKQHIWINGRVVPNGELASEVLSLKPGEALVKGELLVAGNNGNSTEPISPNVKDHLDGNFSIRETHVSVIILHRIHDIFTHNGNAIREDFELLKGQESQKLPLTNIVIGDHPVFIGKNSIVEACTFNTSKGPIYIGAGVELMEGSHFRGPLAIGDGATIKMGAKIYGDTTIGPGCKVGGEVSNCVIFGNTNKAHDGFIGNSVIGEWCNLGADTNTSNLKNTYGEIFVSNEKGEYENTGLQFHGLIMGDHAKCGINTMFNTGTVVGVCANIFGGGFPPKFLPAFTWGGANGIIENDFNRAMETILRVYERRKKKLENNEIEVLKAVFNKTEPYRNEVITNNIN